MSEVWLIQKEAAAHARVCVTTFRKLDPIMAALINAAEAQSAALRAP